MQDPDGNRVFCVSAALASLLLLACRAEPGTNDQAAASMLPAAEVTTTCSEAAHLSGDMTGAIETRFAYTADALDCESMRRPDNAGARLRFVGGSGTDRLSVIIAIPGLVRGEPGSELASNVTVTVEGSGRFFSSADLESCWTDVNAQDPIDDAQYAISGEVYCIAPLAELNGSGAVTIARLSFSSTLDWDAT